MNRLAFWRSSAQGYSHYLNRRERLWRVRTSLPPGPLRDEADLFVKVNNKLEAYGVAARLGITTVRHQVYPTIEAALEDVRDDRFVIKPTGGHSSKGVFLLTRNVRGGFSCAMTGRTYDDAGAVIAAFRHEMESEPKNIRNESVFVEEMVEDSLGYDVPLDYKVYAFQTGTPIVMQRYGPRHMKDKWGFAFYNEAGDSLGPIRSNTKADTRWGLRPPGNLDDVFRTARILIREVPVSFLRIDLYSTPNGVTFGEFTPSPNAGQERFDRRHEALLGEHWRRSLNQLGISYDGEALAPK